MADPRPFVPVVVGPTAVGKTAVAVALSRELSIAVISADSRQVYRELDIGTAKPTLEELQAVRHFGIDVIDPGETYSAGRFRLDVEDWLGEVFEADDRPVLVGGTGLYVKAVAEEFFAEPPIEDEARRVIRGWVSGLEHPGAVARRLDPEHPDGGGLHRAQRGIEVALSSGRPRSWWHRHAVQPPLIEPGYIRLTLDRAHLHRRIALRVKRMLDAGLIEETERHLAAGLDRGSPGLDGVGYAECVRYLEHDIKGMDELTEEITVNTRRYAKRQETWFRNQLPEGHLVLDAGRGTAANVADIMRFLETRVGE